MLNKLLPKKSEKDKFQAKSPCCWLSKTRSTLQAYISIPLAGHAWQARLGPAAQALAGPAAQALAGPAAQALAGTSAWKARRGSAQKVCPSKQEASFCELEALQLTLCLRLQAWTTAPAVATTAVARSLLKNMVRGCVGWRLVCFRRQWMSVKARVNTSVCSCQMLHTSAFYTCPAPVA